MEGKVRNHAMMMVAWTLALYRKYPACRATVRVAADRRSIATGIDSRAIREMLVRGGVRCIATVGAAADIISLANAYSENGCCVLVQMEGLPDSDPLAWQLVVDRRGDYVATVDYSEGNTDPVYPGDLRQFLTGEAVFCVQRVPLWDGSWGRRLRELDGL